MPQRPNELRPWESPESLFGSELRHYREAAKLSLAQFSNRIPYAASTIGAVERAEMRCDRKMAVAADGELKTNDALTRLWDGLFSGNGPIPSWFMDWAKLEPDALTFRSYQPFVVYGLLQVESYARTLLFGDDQAVKARMERQSILHRADPLPPRIFYLMPEIVLWYDVGGREVMREQLTHLADCVSPRLSVQIVPNGVVHPGNVGAFSLATLPDGRDVAYVDTAARGLTMAEMPDIRTLTDAFDTIRSQALPVGMSVDLIRRTVEQRWT
jgi:hypothetical protein